MYCLVKIFEGSLANRWSDSFRFTVKNYKKVHGVLCSGGTDLSIAFDSGRKIFCRNLEQRRNTDIQPNKRPMFFEKALECELISGVITFTDNTKKVDDVSAYLILEE